MNGGMTETSLERGSCDCMTGESKFTGRTQLSRRCEERFEPQGS